MVTRNPTRIGRYELITALATGGMGRIWLGRATSIGGFERKFVIKTLELPRDTAEAEAASAMFLDEARLLGLLHHQHLASVFEVGQDDGRYYMVLDYLDGQTLGDHMTAQAGPITVHPILHIVCEIANGLQPILNCVVRAFRGSNGLHCGIVLHAKT